MESYQVQKQDGIQKQRRITPRLAGFLFWTNVCAVLFLLIGFVAPGWLTVSSRQVMTDHNDKVTYDVVQQDYAIWYVIQCTLNRHEPYEHHCDPRSYRFLEPLDDKRTDRIEVTVLGRAELFFSGSGLVFSKSVVRSYQILYTLAIMVSLLLLAILHYLRGAVRGGSNIALIKQKAFYVILAVLTVFFTFIPVGIFSNTRGKFDQPSKELDQDMQHSLGIVFAGIGGALMILLAASILICHFMDCSSTTIHNWCVNKH